MQPGPAGPKVEIQPSAGWSSAPATARKVAPHHRHPAVVMVEDCSAGNLAAVQDRFPLVSEDRPETRYGAMINLKPYLFAELKVPVAPGAILNQQVPMGGESDTASMVEGMASGEHRRQECLAGIAGQGNRRKQMNRDQPGLWHSSADRHHPF
jgi:hypothetical protein